MDPKNANIPVCTDVNTKGSLTVMDVKKLLNDKFGITVNANVLKTFIEGKGLIKLRHVGTTKNLAIDEITDYGKTHGVCYETRRGKNGDYVATVFTISTATAIINDIAATGGVR